MSIAKNLLDQVKSWRHDFHAHPETGFQEFQTSEKVAQYLRSFGLKVDVGLAGTGVIATLEQGDGPTIGLRADMDALPFTELGNIEHKSKHQGVMHACGHDGHTSILLGAAKILSETRNFKGTVHFVFQPAEENLGGAIKMVEEGLFEKYPMDAIYGLHNWPGLPAGHIGVNPGAMMASLDSFEITLMGKSCHAAMPEKGHDPIVAASQLVLALQTIVSRQVSPLESAVVSITQFNGGEAINIIPEKVTLRGTMRCLHPDVRHMVQARIEQMVHDIPKIFQVNGSIEFFPGYPVTMNHAQQAQYVRETAIEVLGADKVHWDIAPTMASEDFACMLERCPGAYFWLGADGSTPSKPLHNAYYDFNDDIIETGILFWKTLVENQLKSV